MSKVHSIALLQVKGIGVSLYKKLVASFGSAEEVMSASFNEISGVVGEELARDIKGQKLEEADLIVKNCQKLNINITSYESEDYPARLKEIGLPPAVLYYRGELSLLDKPGIGIVGTRKPSIHGSRAARIFSSALSLSGFNVVSGGAYGIDAIALQQAVLEGIPVAVIGNGIDVAYPYQNKKLFEKISEKGIIVSEYPPGTEPRKENFPRRNRIISGLSDAVLVVEAGEKSGSLITAKWAEEQGRDVYAIPGPALIPEAEGTNKLIQMGAKMAIHPSDILSDFGIEEGKKLKSVDNVPLDDDEKTVLSSIGFSPVQMDELAEHLNIPIFKLSSILFGLEMKGLVRQLPGKFYVKD